MKPIFICLALWLLGAMHPVLAQADLSVATSTATITVDAFNNFSAVVTVANNGPNVATNVVLALSPNSSSIVLQGGNAGTVTAGTLNFNGSFWVIPSLAAGASATWTQNWYSLSTAPIIILTSVTACEVSDPDSQPGNADFGGPFEDDAVIVGVNGGVVATPKPDLTIANIDGDFANSQVVGAANYVYVTFSNIGSADATTTSNIIGKVFLSPTPTFDPATSIFLTDIGYGTIGANALGYYSAYYTLPLVSAGTYYMIAIADYSNEIDELDENNNIIASVPLTVTVPSKPNLKVTTSNLPSNITAGTNNTYSITIANNGTVASLPFETVVFFSQDSFLNTYSDLKLRSIQFSAIAPGGVQTKNFTLPLPTNQSGANFFLTSIDNLNQVDEIIENDNFGKKAINVIASNSKPDLQIVNNIVQLTSSPSDANIVVSFSVRNKSNFSVGASNAFVYLSSNSTLSSDDQVILYYATPVLAPNETFLHANLAVYIPFQQNTGVRYLIYVTDPDLRIPETVETNNSRSKAINITDVPKDIRAELAPQSLPNDLSAPINLNIYANYKGQTGSGAFKVRTYYSLDSIYQSTDVQIGELTVPSLLNGDYAYFQVASTFPATAQNNLDFYVISRYDVTNAVTEANELNNTVKARFVPDLFTNSFVQIYASTFVNNLPAFEASQKFEFAFGISNNGTRGLNTFRAKVFISTDDTLSTNDLLITDKIFKVAGDQFYFTLLDTVAIPFNLALGNYKLIVQADPNNAVPEFLESNNVSVVGSFIVVNQNAPDAIVSSFTMPSTINSGETFSANVKIRNIGELPIPENASLSLRICYDSLNQNCNYLNFISLPAIEPGVTHTAIVTQVMQEGYNGNFYFNVLVSDVAGELQLINNKKSTIAKVLDLRPDFEVTNLLATQTGADQMRLTFKVKNVGNTIAPPVRVSANLFNSSTSTSELSNSYNYYFGDSIGVTANLAVGASQQFNLNYKLSNTLFDTLYLARVLVNPNNNFVPEVANNVLNNFSLDTVNIKIVKPNYTYFQFGDGVGEEVKQLTSGNYQIIARDNSIIPQRRLITVDPEGAQLSSIALGEVVAGFGPGEGFTTAKNVGGDSIEVKVYSVSGATVLTKKYTAGGATAVATIRGTADGGFVLGGAKTNTYTDDYQGDKTQIITLGWLLKANSSGVVSWTKNVGAQNVNSKVTNLNLRLSGEISFVSVVLPISTNYGYFAVYSQTISNTGTGVTVFDSTFYYSTSSNSGPVTPIDVFENTSSGILAITNSSYFSYYQGIAYQSSLERYGTSPLVFNAYSTSSYYYYYNAPNAVNFVRYSGAESLNDGSVLATGLSTTNLPSATSLFKIGSDGLFVWEKRGPGVMEDMITAAPNAYALTGKNNGTACLVFINGEGDPIDPPTTTSGGAGMDLALDLQSSATMPGIYSDFPVSIIITNQGTEACTAATIQLSYPAHPAIAYSGVTSISEGTLDLGGKWTLPNGLSIGESDTLIVKFFTLNLNPQTVFAQVQTASPADADSQPGSTVCCTATQDDEDVLIIDPAGTSLMALQAPTYSFQFSAQPNPALNQTELVVNTEKSGFYTLQVIDFQGVVLSDEVIEMGAGRNAFTYSLENLRTGFYILQLIDAAGQFSSLRLLVE